MKPTLKTHGMVPMNRLTDDPRWLPAMSGTRNANGAARS